MLWKNYKITFSNLGASKPLQKNSNKIDVSKPTSLYCKKMIFQLASITTKKKNRYCIRVAQTLFWLHLYSQKRVAVGDCGDLIQADDCIKGRNVWMTWIIDFHYMISCQMICWKPLESGTSRISRVLHLHTRKICFGVITGVRFH